MICLGREEAVVGRDGAARRMASRLGRVRRVGVDERGTRTIIRLEDSIYAYSETTRSKELENPLVSCSFLEKRLKYDLKYEQKSTCSQTQKNSL